MKDPQFLRGVEEFNHGFFFECHDTLEELWMGTVGKDRLFLQGLIQVSVGFYHFFNQNYKGAVSQLTKGLKKLEGYGSSYYGVEVENFVSEVHEWLMIAHHGLAGHPLDPNELRLPKLQMRSEHLSNEGEVVWQH